MNLAPLFALFNPPSDSALLSYGVHDPWLVLLSVFTAIFASWMGLQVVGHAANAGNRSLRAVALLTGSLALGSGVWAMHFIGMLAFDLCTQVQYEPGSTFASMLPSVAASFVALSLIGRQHITVWQLIAGGVLVGLGIGAMHYTGMAAMQSSLALRYDPMMFALSIVIAVVLSTLALWVRFGLQKLRRPLSQGALLAVSATVMGFAMAGMHYTGMAAARFVGQVPAGSTGGTESISFIALAVSLIAAAFTVLVLATNGLLRYRLLYRELRQNLSARKRMEQVLRDSEAQIRSLVANIPGISYRCLMQPDWPMVFISEAIERLSGYPAKDFLGTSPTRSYIELIHPDDRERVMQEIFAAVEAGQDFLVEYRLLHRDGRILWMWEHGSGVFDAFGKVEWLDGVILDITERRIMEDDLRVAKERAEQGAAARAAFLANMSHEIRTPMNAILGFTDVLLQDALAPQQRRHLDTVRSAARSLLRLLNETLDSAKLDKGAMELELADFNLLALIDELSSTMGAGARARGLILNIIYDKTLPLFFHGDEMRVRQVLTNLLGNAIKFTDSGRVTLEVAPEQGQLHFIVRDTGIGIPSDRMAAIFEPFTQADASMSRRFGGTGLGTTISKQLTELMGGKIWAESVLDEGSAFHVLLPLPPARRDPQTWGNPAALACLPAGVPDQTTPMPAQPLDRARMQQLAVTLTQAFQRGALDDAALVELLAGLAAHVDAVRLEQLQTALDDFNFQAAHDCLFALMAALPNVPLQEVQ